MEKLLSSKLELSETNSVETFSLYDVHVASVVEPVVELQESGEVPRVAPHMHPHF